MEGEESKREGEGGGEWEREMKGEMESKRAWEREWESRRSMSKGSTRGGGIRKGKDMDGTVCDAACCRCAASGLPARHS